jgi:hypothetical protein
VKASLEREYMNRRANDRTERRARKRYSIHCKVSYSIPKGGVEASSGEGTTLNISSTGVLFRATAALKPGSYVVLYMDWPACTEDGTPLILVVTGPVVWSQGDIAAMCISRYGFAPESKAASGLQLLYDKQLTPSRAASVMSTRIQRQFFEESRDEFGDDE